jgi:hypothetical protein
MKPLALAILSLGFFAVLGTHDMVKTASLRRGMSVDGAPAPATDAAVVIVLR